MKWWHWLLIAVAAFAVGALAGNLAWGGGAVAGIAAMFAASWRDSADRGLEWSDEMRRKTEADNLERKRRADEAAVREAGARASARVRKLGVPVAPPKSRHLNPGDVEDWT